MVEIILALIVLAILVTIALGSYRQYIERLNTSKAIQDIARMSQALERYRTENATYPDALAAIGWSALDPWGHAYRYLAIDVDPPPKTGQVRRDKNLNPLNNDYDLYSMGPDGRTQTQVTARFGRDDIIRAADGSYIGVAGDF